jgi:hypothetical protein
MAAFEAKVLDVRSQASLTRNPFSPSSTASAACIGEVRSAVYRNAASSPR